MKKNHQLVLFEDWETSTGALELFPAVWEAAQNLAHPENKVRQEALDILVKMNAPRLSALISYLIATRLMDPDIKLRHQVVQILGELLGLDPTGRETEPTVRQFVTTYLTQMRTRGVYSLLQVAELDEEMDEIVARLLNLCPFAGEHLADIFIDRKLPLSVRKKAIFFVGQVGYLDAQPDLERLESRLESRLSGQQSMPFAPTGALSEEEQLLPIVHRALTLLRTP